MLPIGASVKVKLTTTSYVILGLLALRPWPTYELARQMRRSIRYYWPRAESNIYEEPKKLVAHGLATATHEYSGRRRRTVYAITDDGRRRLAEWLDEPGRLPLVEFEGLLKVLFAEHGSKDQLVASLAALREQAAAVRADHAALARDLVETGGPFPDRLHVNALVFGFMWEQAEALRRWLDWAEAEIAGWPDDIATPPDAEAARASMRAAAGEAP